MNCTWQDAPILVPVPVRQVNSKIDDDQGGAGCLSPCSMCVCVWPAWIWKLTVWPLLESTSRGSFILHFVDLSFIYWAMPVVPLVATASSHQQPFSFLGRNELCRHLGCFHVLFSVTEVNVPENCAESCQYRCWTSQSETEAVIPVRCIRSLRNLCNSSTSTSDLLETRQRVSSQWAGYLAAGANIDLCLYFAIASLMS